MRALIVPVISDIPFSQTLPHCESVPDFPDTQLWDMVPAGIQLEALEDSSNSSIGWDPPRLALALGLLRHTAAAGSF